MGAAFDVQSVDVDGDGTDEIVLTNHQSGKKFGGAEPAVFVYDVKVPEEPAHAAGFLVQKQGDDANFGATFATTTNITDFMSRIQFTRRTISGKLNVVNRSFMAAGPGGAQVVPAHVVNANDDVHHMPPVVIVSGDGTEKAYLLTRNVDSDLVDGGVVPEYTQTEFHDCKGTVGGILVRDLDGDGWQEVVVPCYDTNEIAVYTFAP